MKKLETVGDVIQFCPVGLADGEPSAEVQQRLPKNHEFITGSVKPWYTTLLERLSKGMQVSGEPRWSLRSIIVTETTDLNSTIGWGILKIFSRDVDTKAIFGHIELDESRRGEGLGRAAYVAAQLSLPENYTLIAGRPRTDSAEAVWKSLVQDGLADGYAKGWVSGSPDDQEMQPMTHYAMHDLQVAE